MTSVTYHGELPDGQDSIEQHCYVFERGKSVNVTNAEHLRKLAGNRFFKVAGKSDKELVEQGKDEAESAEVQSLQDYLREQNVPFHHKAGLTKLRDLKEAHETAQAKAAEE